MSKGTKKQKSKRDSKVDAAKIEQLIDRCLNTQYSLSWYRPDNAGSLPWDDIVEAFQAGYNYALDAVLRALHGDGGERLQQILDREIIIVRPADREEYQAKLAQGLKPIHFNSREEAEEFLAQLANFDAKSAPYDCPN